MAANNYFGFNHSAGAPQYPNTSNPAYQTQPSSYGVIPSQSQPPGYGIPPNQSQNNSNVNFNSRSGSGYEACNYQSVPPTTTTYVAPQSANVSSNYDYSGYSRSATVNTSSQYNSSKGYYQQLNQTTSQPYNSSSDYQSKTTSYNNSYSVTQSRPSSEQHKSGYVSSNCPNQGQPQVSVTAAYIPQSSNQSLISNTTSTAATNNYCTSYPTSNFSPDTKVKSNFQPSYNAQNKPGNSMWFGYSPKPGIDNKRRPKQPKVTPQLHYCDVCRISCAGPQTFKEHIQGQRHKKKEAQQKEGVTPPTSSASKTHTLKCELCDVTCTGSDAYAAHLKGLKHQKVVKLHTKLAKPIPEVDLQTALTAASVTKPPAIKTDVAKNGVSGSNVKTEKENSQATNGSDSATGTPSLTPLIAPVGAEYVEEIKDSDGKLVTFSCKLCDCKFNDPNAKEMHMKGRRHRLQYKKKVNPELVVDVKSSGRRNRAIAERLIQRDSFMRRKEIDGSFWNDRILNEERAYWEEMKRSEEAQWLQRGGGPPHPASQFGGYVSSQFGLRRPETIDDRHFNAKLQLIAASDNHLSVVKKYVSLVENVLTDACNQVAQNYKEVKTTDETETKDAPANGKSKNNKVELVKGIVQVGYLPKNLFLVFDKTCEFVILISAYPTRSLLQAVYNAFQKLINERLTEKHSMTINLDRAQFSVTFSLETELHFVIHLTSPMLRNENETKPPPGTEVGLNVTHCLDSLALVRRTRWFVARPGTNWSSVMVIRILRDLCRQNPTWAPLSDWTVELLVDRVVGGVGLSGAEALRKVLEGIAGGVLTNLGLGLADPCERNPTDASGHLTLQQSCDITASAQHALRLFAFRQIYKVLGINRIATQNVHRFNRKRKIDNCAGSPQELDSIKKDKKDKVLFT